MVVTHAALVARSKRETLSKADAGYIEDDDLKACGTCEYFSGPFRCTILKTVVDPAKGCCDLWEDADED